jgi:hypothetical protein
MKIFKKIIQNEEGFVFQVVYLSQFYSFRGSMLMRYNSLLHERSTEPTGINRRENSELNIWGRIHGIILRTKEQNIASTY